MISRSEPLSKVGKPEPIYQVRTDISLLSEERMAVKNGYLSQVKIGFQGNYFGAKIRLKSVGAKKQITRCSSEKMCLLNQ
jgi:hypothetical protein